MIFFGYIYAAFALVAITFALFAVYTAKDVSDAPFSCSSKDTTAITAVLAGAVWPLTLLVFAFYYCARGRTK